MRDSEIEQCVINQINLGTGKRLKELCVFALNGVVNLKGTVRCRADRRAAQDAAGRAKGVVGVINQLNLRSRSASRCRAGVKLQPISSSSTFRLPDSQTVNSSRAAT